MKVTQALTRKECEDILIELDDHGCNENCKCDSGHTTEAAKLFTSILSKKSVFSKKIKFSFDEIASLRELNKSVIENKFKYFNKLSMIAGIIESIEWKWHYSMFPIKISKLLYNEDYIAIPLTKNVNNEWFLDAYRVAKLITVLVEGSFIYPNSLTWVNQIKRQLNTENKYDYIIMGLGHNS